MKRMLRLIGNEYRKQLKRPAMLVILIVLAAFLFLSPVMMEGILYLDRLTMTVNSPEENAKLSRNLEELYRGYAESDEEERDYYLFMADLEASQAAAYDALAEIGVEDCGDWRWDLIREYVDACGKADQYQKHVLTGNIPPEELERYGWSSDAAANREYYRDAVRRRDDAFRQIEENDYFGYIRQLRQENLSSLIQEEDTLARLKAAAETSDTEDNLLAVENQEWTVFSYRQIDDCYQLILDLDIPDGDSWENNTLEHWRSTAQSVGYTYELPTRSEYDSMGYFSSGMSYEAYRDNVRQQRAEAADEFTLLRYSLENGKPLYDMARSSRYLTTFSLHVIILITLFGVVLAAGSVSREFSSGTVRLLLIRPVKRWKILLSKYLMVLSLCLGLTALVYVSYLLFAALLEGGSDLLYPYLYLSGGKVVQIPFPLYLLGQTAFVLISVLFGVTLAFFLSTLVRNSVLATILPVGLSFSYFFCTIFSLFSPLLLRILLWTPFFYTDLSYWAGDSGAILGGLVTGADAGHPVFGAVSLVALSAGMLAGALAFFSRHDVKN